MEGSVYMEETSIQVMYAVRLLFSCVCGLAIGFERQTHIRNQHRKSAGMRTHMLVCVASAAMMLISKYGFMDVLVYGDGVRVDVSRVAAAIVSGVGFLGAGIIYLRRESIKGLTTAAGLWATSAVGMAVGCGIYLVGVILAVLVVMIQELARIRLYREEDKLSTVIIELENKPGAAKDIIEWIEEKGIEVHNVVSRKTEKHTQSLTLHVYWGDIASKQVLLTLLDERDGVKQIEF